jgi:hypothetical protein
MDGRQPRNVSQALCRSPPNNHLEALVPKSDTRSVSRASLRTHSTSVLFETVRAAASELPGVEEMTRYDGSPVLKLDGCFLAGIATHRSAERDTLVVRYGIDDREWLLEEAPDTYYLTSYYRPYPLILVRLQHVGHHALRDLLTVSWQLTAAKSPRRRPPVVRG